MQDLSNGNTRITWIDAAKLTGIFLVLLGHVTCTSYFLKVFIYTFHMPLFFFLSGLVEKKHSLRETIIHSAKKLLIPYVLLYLCVWAFILLFLRNLLGEPGIQGKIIKPLAGLFIGLGYDTPYSIMVAPPLWFLPALFWCKVINSIVNKFSENLWIKTLFAAIFFAFSIVIKKTGFHPYFSIGAAFMAFPFFFMGITCQKIREKAETILYSLPVRPLAPMLFAIIWIIAKFNGEIDINSMGFGKNPLLLLIGGVAGIILVCHFSTSIKKLPAFLNFYAQNTLIIMGFHQVIGIKISQLLYKTGLLQLNDGKFSIRAALIISIIELFACGLPAIFVKLFNDYARHSK